MTSLSNDSTIAIVGAGISGLAAATFARKKWPSRPILILETSERLGGVVSTDLDERIAFERGPLSISAELPLVRELLEDLELTHLLVSSEGPSARYIYADSQLRHFSFDPRRMIREGLLSAKGVARALAEPLVSRKTSDEPEAVWDFFARRFGAEVAEKLVQPLLLGITTGETRDTDMETLFPDLARREREDGSILRSLGRETLMRRNSLSTRQYWLKDGGLQQISNAVSALPLVEVCTSTPVLAFERGEDASYTLHGPEGRSFTAQTVILATPSYVSAGLLRDHVPQAAELLSRIDYYGMALVQFVYAERDLESLPRRMQMLVRRGQGVRMIAAQTASEIFPDLAKDGYAVLRCLYGGEFDRNASALTHQELVRTARVELASMLGLETIPVREHVMVWPDAVPHFRPGHLRNMERVTSSLASLPNVEVIGAGMRGLSIAACIEVAKDCVGRLALSTAR